METLDTLLVIQRVSDSSILCLKTEECDADIEKCNVVWFPYAYVPNNFGYITISEKELRLQGCFDLASQNEFLPFFVELSVGETYDNKELRFLRLILGEHIIEHPMMLQ